MSLFSVSDGRITAIDTDTTAQPGSNRLRGLVIPGLANAHSHAFHRALRSRTQRDRGSFWTWRDLMYRAAERLNPDRYRRLTRAVYAEMALAGITIGRRVPLCAPRFRRHPLRRAQRDGTRRD